MPDDKLISQLNENVNPQMTDMYETETAGGLSLWTSLTRIAALILGNRTIGGNAATDIPTNNSAGTQTNKRYDYPKFNSNTQVTITSEDANKLPSHIAGTGNKHAAAAILATSLLGNFTTVQEGFTWFENYLAQLTERYSSHRLYQYEFTSAAGLALDIKEADILAQIAADEPVDVVILPGAQVMVKEIDGSKRTKSQAATDEAYDTTDNGQMHLQNVIIDGLSTGVKYEVTISCKIFTKA